MCNCGCIKVNVLVILKNLFYQCLSLKIDELYKWQQLIACQVSRRPAFHEISLICPGPASWATLTLTSAGIYWVYWVYCSISNLVHCPEWMSMITFWSFQGCGLCTTLIFQVVRSFRSAASCIPENFLMNLKLKKVNHVEILEYLSI